LPIQWNSLRDVNKYRTLANLWDGESSCLTVTNMAPPSLEFQTLIILMALSKLLMT
jgi:hypothetical protein